MIRELCIHCDLQLSYSCDNIVLQLTIFKRYLKYWFLYLQSDLPATVRVVQERMLDVLKETIKDKAKEHKEKKSLKRSMKVKFFGG